ncbi:hypothetical protein ACTXT7_005593 [Hymenolepis weldensis]
MSRCRSLGVMIDTRLGIYVQTCKHITGPSVDTTTYVLTEKNEQEPYNYWQSEQRKRDRQASGFPPKPEILLQEGPSSMPPPSGEGIEEEKEEEEEGDTTYITTGQVEGDNIGAGGWLEVRSKNRRPRNPRRR